MEANHRKSIPISHFFALTHKGYGSIVVDGDLCIFENSQGNKQLACEPFGFRGRMNNSDAVGHLLFNMNGKSSVGGLSKED